MDQDKNKTIPSPRLNTDKTWTLSKPQNSKHPTLLAHVGHCLLHFYVSQLYPILHPSRSNALRNPIRITPASWQHPTQSKTPLPLNSSPKSPNTSPNPKKALIPLTEVPSQFPIGAFSLSAREDKPSCQLELSPVWLESTNNYLMWKIHFRRGKEPCLSDYETCHSMQIALVIVFPTAFEVLPWKEYWDRREE